MIEKESLFLHEEVLLLALKDKEGTIAPGTKYQYGISGAILAEMLLTGRIEVAEAGKQMVNLVNAKPMGDPLLNECLKWIKTANRRATLQNWVTRFANIKKLKNRIAEPLCRRAILRVDEDTIPFLIPRRKYPPVKPETERKLIERLHTAIFTDAPKIDPKTIVLVSLADSAGVLKVIFLKRALRNRKKRMEQVISGEVVGKTSKDAIAAAQSAAMVACIIPAVITTTFYR